MTRLGCIAPCFIVDDFPASVEFYCSGLGFEVTYSNGEFFGIVQRDGVMIMLKAVSPEIHPLPNRSRHAWEPWDAYVYVPEPHLLYAELLGRGVSVHRELGDTSDGLRTFEILDNSGYLLCFGRPVEKDADERR